MFWGREWLNLIHFFKYLFLTYFLKHQHIYFWYKVIPLGPELGPHLV